jgi:hypothetical protein
LEEFGFRPRKGRWTKFSPTAEALFPVHIDKPGRTVSGDELADTLDIPNGKHGVAGVLA